MLVPQLTIGQEVNANKTMYMVMSRDQSAGRSRSLKADNTSFESQNISDTTLTDQNSIQEEIKSILNSERLQSFGAESFVFQFAIEKYED